MPNKQQSAAGEGYADDVPLVKRLRRSTQSTAADEETKNSEELFHTLRNFLNEEGRSLCEELFRHPLKK
ncbi:hypothetical protein D918_05290 [Trichuris suis]|nr:hypothetical protein D918_05290 [Trichuris suis]